MKSVLINHFKELFYKYNNNRFSIKILCLCYLLVVNQFFQSPNSNGENNVQREKIYIHLFKFNRFDERMFGVMFVGGVSKIGKISHT